VVVAQRRWQLRIDAVSADLPEWSWLPVALAAGGTVLSAMLASLVAVLTTSRARARAEVVRATADLRAAQSELGRDKDHSETVAAVAATLAASGVDSRAVGATIAHELADRVGDHALVVRYDADTGEVEGLGVATRGGPVPPEVAAAFCEARVDLDQATNLALAAATGTTLIDIEDFEAFLGSVAEPVRTIMRDRPVRHLLIVPMHDGDLLAAAVVVTRIDDSPFAGRDIELVEDIAARAGYAIANARLYEQSAAAEAALRASQTELERVNRDLDRFAATAAHDLRAPLTSISGFSQLLATDYADALDETAMEYLAHVDDSARHLGELTSDLLSLARVRDQAMAREPVDLNAVVARATGSLRASIERTGAQVTVDRLPVVWGDAGLLERLVQNLVGNALKYQPAGQVPRVHLWARPQGEDQTVLHVTDNGIGIDPEQAEAIFQPFHRVRTVDVYPGSGLGLAVCQRIAERHDGRIWATPDPAGGTTFSCTLPVAVIDLATAATPASPT
jgi:signal transduction histidine kinase